MELSIARLGGRLDCSHPKFVYNAGEEDILISKGSSLHLISSKTGELVNTFEDHKSTISSISESDANDIWTSSVDGYIYRSKFPFDNNSQSKVEYVGVPVYDVLSYSSEEMYLVVGSKTHSDTIYAKDYKLVSYNLLKSKIVRNICKVTGPHQCITKLQIPISNNGKMSMKNKQDIIVAASKSKLTIWSPITHKIITSKSCPGVSGSITCMVASKQSGHRWGEILIWRNISTLLSDDSKPVCTRLHWHSQAVRSLAISIDNLYFYSGGDEGVLVIWKIQNNEKTYLPRLGSSITSITPGNEGILVTTSDNTIRIIHQASMKSKWQLKQLYAPISATISEKSHRQSDKNYQFQITVEPRSGLVATNGYPGELQMSDISTLYASQSINYSITPSNTPAFIQSVYKTSYIITDYTRITGKEASTVLYVPSISHYKFYQTPKKDNILCTVDVRRGEGLDPETSLKLWYWHMASNTYKLAAQVDRPHEAHKVTSLDISYNAYENKVICVTSCTNGSIKLWSGSFIYEPSPSTESSSTTISNDISIIKKDSTSLTGVSHAIGMTWSCTYSFTYRHGYCSYAHFSWDSSMLCLVHGSVVSIWNPVDLSLHATIQGPLPMYPVQSVHTIETNQSHELNKDMKCMYIVLCTRGGVSVFDLLTLKHLWTVQGHVTCISVASDSATCIHAPHSTSLKVLQSVYIAIAMSISSTEKDTNTHEIQLYHPQSNKIIHTYEVASDVSSMTFLSTQNIHTDLDSNNNHSGCLLVLTISGELLALRQIDKSEQLLHTTQSLIVSSSTLTTTTTTTSTTNNKISGTTTLSYAQVKQPTVPVIAFDDKSTTIMSESSHINNDPLNWTNLNTIDYSNLLSINRTPRTTVDAMFESLMSFKKPSIQPVPNAVDTMNNNVSRDITQLNSAMNTNTSGTTQSRNTVNMDINDLDFYYNSYEQEKIFHTNLSHVQSYFASILQKRKQDGPQIVYITANPMNSSILNALTALSNTTTTNTNTTTMITTTTNDENDNQVNQNMTSPVDPSVETIVATTSKSKTKKGKSAPPPTTTTVTVTDSVSTSHNSSKEKQASVAALAPVVEDSGTESDTSSVLRRSSRRKTTATNTTTAAIVSGKIPTTILETVTENDGDDNEGVTPTPSKAKKMKTTHNTKLSTIIEDVDTSTNVNKRKNKK